MMDPLQASDIGAWRRHYLQALEAA